jgi:two-component system, response regulator PdtaR
VEKSRAALAEKADYLDGSFQVVRNRMRMRVSGRWPHPVAWSFAVMPGMSGGVAKQVLYGSEATRTGPRDAGFSMSNHRIVVVEDDVFIRLDLTTQLRAAGHTVVGTADSAAEAVRVVEHERPDLVLMDVRLVGDRDGIEAATEIWQRFAIRSLFVSANLDAAARAKASAANPVGFLEKPFTPNGLLAAVAAGA